MDFSSVESIYFVGVGGIGMSGLAEFALRKGKSVYGSDAKPNAMTARLQELGAKIKFVQDGRDLPKVDLCVVSTAIHRDNADYAGFKDIGVNICHRSELLQSICAGSRLIAVSGTHGKTTTSSIITYLLDRLGCDPSAIVGGIMKDYNSNIRVGAGEYFVIEADESDGSFVNYRPHIITINNIAKDHLDVHGSIEGVMEAFGKFLDGMDPDGTAVVGWDDNLVRKVCEDRPSSRLTFGKKMGCEVRLVKRQSEEDNPLEAWEAMVEYDRIRVEWPLFGVHNCLNGLAALAVCRALRLDCDAAARHLTQFGGVSRRLELLHSENGTIVLDDYAHNPDKIAAALTAVRERWPGHSLVAVFQPHRFSRLRTMEREFLDAFQVADEILLLPTYAAGEDFDPNYSPENLLELFQQRHDCPVHAAESIDHAIKMSKQISQMRSPCVIISVGAGDVYRVTHGIYEQENSC